MNINTSSSSNQDSPRSKNNVTPSLCLVDSPFERRDVRVGDRGVNLVNLFSFGYGNTGYYVMKYLFSSDVKNLREVCTGMCSRLFQKGIFITPTKLERINQHVCPRLHARVQYSNLPVFQPVPADAVVKNVNDLQTILKDVRFVVKGIVFRGEWKELKEVCESLPQAIEAIEIGIEIPPNERLDLRQYQELKVIRVKNMYNSSILRRENVSVSCDEDLYSFLPKQREESVEDRYGFSRELSCAEKEQIIDSNNALFNSFIGVNRIPLGAVQMEESIGSGKFGEVRKGAWGNRLVALKTLNLVYSTNKELLEWEIARLSTADHPNIVQFYGIYQDANGGPTCLAMEFCERGNLEEALNKLPRKEESWSKRWQWALEISQGVAYLHSQGVLHRDLKAENVLLDGNGRAKLADLGLAQVDALLEESELQEVKQGKQDKRFIAPENVDNPSLSTQATDVYALGLVFWQIATRGEEPRTLFDIDFIEWNKGNLIEREPIPKNCPESFKELILFCWERDPSKRPSAEKLVGMLEALGAGFAPKHHILIKACQKLEKIIYQKRKEGLSYIAPFVIEHRVGESIESYWSRIEASKQKLEEEKNPPPELENRFREFTEKTEPATLLLLGESGLGKTLTTYRWADDLLSEWWAHIDNKEKAAPKYFPLFIRRTASNWTHSALKEAYLNTLKEYDLQGCRVTMLIFIDGYDELQMDEEPFNLVERLGLSNDDKIKIIVSCRPDAVDSNFLGKRFSFKGNLQIYYFLPFRFDQIVSYLKNELSWNECEAAQAEKALQNFKSTREVLRNPFMLYLLKQSWKTVFKQPLDKLNRWKIYEGFVNHLITTQCTLLSSKVQGALKGNYTSLVESFQAFTNDIAFGAFQNKNMTWSLLNLQRAEGRLSCPWARLEGLVGQDAREQFTHRQEKLNKVSEKEKAQKERRAILSEEDFISMMQRRRQQFEINLPLRIRGEMYEFSHRSLLEYFVANWILRLCEGLRNNTAGMVTDGFRALIDKLMALDAEILLFLKEGWEEEEIKGLTASSIIGASISSEEMNPRQYLANIAILFDTIGEILYERINYKEALKYYRKALAINERVYENEDLNVASSYNRIGVVLCKQGKNGEGLEYLLKALFITKKECGEEHSNVAQCYNNIGAAFQTQGRYEEAIEYHLKALAIREKNKDNSDIAMSYNNIAEVLKVQGKSDEAIKYFNNALAIFENLKQMHVKEESSIAQSSSNIDNLYAQGKYEESAIAFYAQEVNYFWGKEKRNRQELQETAQLCSNTGNALCTQGKYAQALEYYQKALAIEEEVYGKDHPAVADSCIRIGEVLAYQGKEKQALEYYLQALNIKEKLDSKGHEEVAQLYNDIGRILFQQGRHEEAIKYYLKNLAICKKVFGKEHVKVADSSTEIGLALQLEGKNAKAFQYFQRALAIYEKSYGKEHPNVVQSYMFSGGILAAQEKYGEAMKYYLQGLAICEKVHGKEHSKVAGFYYDIGLILSKQSRYEKAMEYSMKALAIREKWYGKTDSAEVAQSCTNIGVMLDIQGRAEEAMEYHRKALAIFKKVSHPDVAISYQNIGLVLSKQGRHAEALEYYRQASTTYEKVYGPAHPNNIDCMQNIQYLERQIFTREKVSWQEVVWTHPDINIFIGIAATNTAQDLLKVAEIASNEVKVISVDTSKIGKMHLSLNFSSGTAFKRFVKYYREKYNNLFLPHSQWEYNPGQAVEIFIDTKVLQDVMPELERYRNSILQEKK